LGAAKGVLLADQRRRRMENHTFCMRRSRRAVIGCLDPQLVGLDLLFGDRL